MSNTLRIGLSPADVGYESKFGRAGRAVTRRRTMDVSVARLTAFCPLP